MLALAAALALLTCLLSPEIPSTLLKARSKRSSGSAFNSAAPQKNLRADGHAKVIAALPAVVAHAPARAASPLLATPGLPKAAASVTAHQGRAPPVPLV
jgi:hypothetical protein